MFTESAKVVSFGNPAAPVTDEDQVKTEDTVAEEATITDGLDEEEVLEALPVTAHTFEVCDGFALESLGALFANSDKPVTEAVLESIERKIESINDIAALEAYADKFSSVLEGFNGPVKAMKAAHVEGNIGTKGYAETMKRETGKVAFVKNMLGIGKKDCCTMDDVKECSGVLGKISTLIKNKKESLHKKATECGTCATEGKDIPTKGNISDDRTLKPVDDHILTKKEFALAISVAQDLANKEEKGEKVPALGEGLKWADVVNGIHKGHYTAKALADLANGELFATDEDGKLKFASKEAEEAYQRANGVKIVSSDDDLDENGKLKANADNDKASKKEKKTEAKESYEGEYLDSYEAFEAVLECIDSMDDLVALEGLSFDEVSYINTILELDMNGDDIEAYLAEEGVRDAVKAAADRLKADRDEKRAMKQALRDDAKTVTSDKKAVKKELDKSKAITGKDIAATTARIAALIAILEAAKKSVEPSKVLDKAAQEEIEWFKSLPEDGMSSYWKTDEGIPASYLEGFREQYEKCESLIKNLRNFRLSLPDDVREKVGELISCGKKSDASKVIEDWAMSKGKMSLDAAKTYAKQYLDRDSIWYALSDPSAKVATPGVSKELFKELALEIPEKVAAAYKACGLSVATLMSGKIKVGISYKVKDYATAVIAYNELNSKCKMFINDIERLLRKKSANFKAYMANKKASPSDDSIKKELLVALSAADRLAEQLTKLADHLEKDKNIEYARSKYNKLIQMAKNSGENHQAKINTLIKKVEASGYTVTRIERPAKESFTEFLENLAVDDANIATEAAVEGDVSFESIQQNIISTLEGIKTKHFDAEKCTAPKAAMEELAEVLKTIDTATDAISGLTDVEAKTAALDWVVSQRKAVLTALKNVEAQLPPAEESTTDDGIEDDIIDFDDIELEDETASEGIKEAFGDIKDSITKSIKAAKDMITGSDKDFDGAIKQLTNAADSLKIAKESAKTEADKNWCSKQAEKITSFLKRVVNIKAGEPATAGATEAADKEAPIGYLAAEASVEESDTDNEDMAEEADEETDALDEATEAITTDSELRVVKKKIAGVERELKDVKKNRKTLEKILKANRKSRNLTAGMQIATLTDKVAKLLEQQNSLMSELNEYKEDVNAYKALSKMAASTTASLVDEAEEIEEIGKDVIEDIKAEASPDITSKINDLASRLKEAWNVLRTTKKDVTVATAGFCLGDEYTTIAEESLVNIIKCFGDENIDEDATESFTISAEDMIACEGAMKDKKHPWVINYKSLLVQINAGKKTAAKEVRKRTYEDARSSLESAADACREIKKMVTSLSKDEYEEFSKKSDVSDKVFDRFKNSIEKRMDKELLSIEKYRDKIDKKIERAKSRATEEPAEESFINEAFKQYMATFGLDEEGQPIATEGYIEKTGSGIAGEITLDTEESDDAMESYLQMELNSNEADSDLELALYEADFEENNK